MTKAELRTQFQADGWTVQPVEDWMQVSAVDGVVKYDVQVISPDDQFATAQVKVTGDGQAEEETTPLGVLQDEQPSFRDRLTTFLRTVEENQATIFAAAATQVYASDAVAEVKAFLTDNTTQMYVVKERSGSFSHQQTS